MVLTMNFHLTFAGKTLIWCLLPLLGQSGRAAASFHVSPGGDDLASGSALCPFATLECAVAAARTLGTAESRQIIMHGGNYYNVCVALGPDDSNLTIEAAEDEKPMLYGGQLITNWFPISGSLYAAQLPSFPQKVVQSGISSVAGQWQPRMFLVDGVMCPRSRYPARDNFTYLNVFSQKWQGTTAGGWAIPPTQAERNALKYRPENLGAWLVPANAQLSIEHSWSSSFVGVSAIDTGAQMLTLSPLCEYPLGAFGINNYVVYNIAEGMTSPGQWYHDVANNRIVYWPLAGQTVNSATCIVPTTTKLFHLNGTPNAKIRNIVLSGLTLAATTVPLSAGGWLAVAFEGAIQGDYTENCAFNRLVIGPVAGHGLTLRSSNDGALIRDCEIKSCGAGGIYVKLSTKTLITNNVVHGLGVLFPGAVGIQAGSGSSIVNNEVYDLGYSGIVAEASNVLIQSNLVRNCLQTLSDGGGIYVSACTNVTLRGNLVRDIANPADAGRIGIYMDEQARDCLVEGNTTLNVRRALLNNAATNITHVNNTFVSPENLIMIIGKSSGCRFDKNIGFASETIRLSNFGSMYSGSNNVLYGQKKDLDSVLINTIYTDPSFMDRAGEDLRLQPQSPALRQGIYSMDARGVGKRPWPPGKVRSAAK